MHGVGGTPTFLLPASAAQTSLRKPRGAALAAGPPTSSLGTGWTPLLCPQPGLGLGRSQRAKAWYQVGAAPLRGSRKLRSLTKLRVGGQLTVDHRSWLSPTW